MKDGASRMHMKKVGHTGWLPVSQFRDAMACNTWGLASMSVHEDTCGVTIEADTVCDDHDDILYRLDRYPTADRHVIMDTGDAVMALMWMFEKLSYHDSFTEMVNGKRYRNGFPLHVNETLPASLDEMIQIIVDGKRYADVVDVKNMTEFIRLFGYRSFEVLDITEEETMSKLLNEVAMYMTHPERARRFHARISEIKVRLITRHYHPMNIEQLSGAVLSEHFHDIQHVESIIMALTGIASNSPESIINFIDGIRLAGNPFCGVPNLRTSTVCRTVYEGGSRKTLHCLKAEFPSSKFRFHLDVNENSGDIFIYVSVTSGTLW